MTSERKLQRGRVRAGNITDWVLMGFMILVCFITLYPVWYSVILSFNEASDTMFGGIYWWPRKFSLESYRTVFLDNSIMRAFAVSVSRTVVGTLTSVFFTAMVAFAFSKRHIMGRKVYMTLGIITMFFNGGLIPYFILIKNIGLYDSFLVYVIPALFNFWNLLIFMSFFHELPPALEESAKIDGANEFRIFVQIVIPLSMPVLATIALFNGVGQWNDYFSGVMYINNPDLQPIQTYLYRIIASASASRSVVNNLPVGVTGQQVNSQSVKLATMVITTAPIICVYPFMQKYFVKGVMIGSVKG